MRSAEELAQHLPEADVLVVSMLWSNELAGIARKLKFIQSISAGVDQYDKDLLRARGIRLASAAGVNAQAVAEHAMALMLALQPPPARGARQPERQALARHDPEIAAREDQLTGKTLLIVGLGRIGARLAQLAKAFDMRVIATKRDPRRRCGRRRRRLRQRPAARAAGPRPTSWPSPAR